MNKKSKIWSVDKENLQLLLNTSQTYKEVLIKLGFEPNGNYQTLKRRLIDESFDLSCISEKSSENIKNNAIKNSLSKKKLEDILVENSNYGRSSLKRRLIQEKILENKCFKCSVKNTWEGQPLNLQLDHLNGNPTDNRLFNIRLLCPNCHSQTPTFSGRNKKKKEKKEEFCLCGNIKLYKRSEKCFKCSSSDNSIKNRKVLNRPSLEELQKKLENNSYVDVGKVFDVSDNTIRKWIKNYKKL